MSDSELDRLEAEVNGKGISAEKIKKLDTFEQMMVELENETETIKAQKKDIKIPIIHSNSNNLGENDYHHVGDNHLTNNVSAPEKIDNIANENNIEDLDKEAEELYNLEVNKNKENNNKQSVIQEKKTTEIINNNSQIKNEERSEIIKNSDINNNKVDKQVLEIEDEDIYPENIDNLLFDIKKVPSIVVLEKEKKLYDEILILKTKLKKENEINVWKNKIKIIDTIILTIQNNVIEEKLTMEDYKNNCIKSLETENSKLSKLNDIVIKYKLSNSVKNELTRRINERIICYNEEINTEIEENPEEEKINSNFNFESIEDINIFDDKWESKFFI